MYRGNERSTFIRLLQAAVWLSLAYTLVILFLALFKWNLSGVIEQMLLTSVGVLAGSLLMIVLLRARPKAGPVLALFIALGVAAAAAAMVSFIVLVWSGFASNTLLLRTWRLAMPAALVIALVVVLQAASFRRGGAVVVATDMMAIWAGAMLAWPALRSDMLVPRSDAYWWTLAFPAVCTAVGALYVLARRALGAPRPGQASKAGALVLLLITHVMAAMSAYNVGKAVRGEQKPASTDKR
jgi:hypothetical protein